MTHRADDIHVVVIRYIFSADGKYLLGGMMVGETSDYVKLVALVKKKVRHFVQVIFLIIGSDLLHVAFRKPSRFPHPSSSLGPTLETTPVPT